MGEIYTNPVSGGQTEIIDPTTGAAAEVATDAATLADAFDGLRSIASIFGHDGSDWRRVKVNASGELVISSGAATGNTIRTPSTVSFTVNNTGIYTAVPGDLAVNVQNVSASTATIIRVRAAGSTTGTGGILLPKYGIMSFNKAVDDLVVDVASGPTPGLVNVVVEEA